LDATKQGDYWAVVTTSAGVVTSTVAHVEMAVPVSIVAQPQSQTNAVGGVASFTVGLAGTPPFSYQWRRNGEAIAGATDASLIFSGVQFADAGSYSVVVNNPANQPLLSAEAWLVVVEGTPVPTNGLGWFSTSNGCYVVTGSGEDIEGNEDRFFFVYRPLEGDGQVVAYLSNLNPDNRLSEAGIMLRDGLQGGDRHVFLAMNADQRAVFRRRPRADYNSLDTWRPGTNAAWLRLMRMGDVFSGQYSVDGVNWEMAWWTTVSNMPPRLQAGIAVTSHRHNAFATGTFCNWTVSGLTPVTGWVGGGAKLWPAGEPYAHPPMTQVGGLRLLLTGSAGERYTVLSAESVDAPAGQWTPVGNVTNTYGVAPFVDPQAIGGAQRFYRLQQMRP
jgi:hypothetical protein